MNWSIHTNAKNLADTELDVSQHTDEAKDEPNADLVKAAKAAAGQVADTLGGAKDIHIEIQAHETTKGRGFRPAHVTITVSRLDPKRNKD